jgi:hypothetical protein
MRCGAFLHLLVRPAGILFAGLFMPVAVIMLFWAGARGPSKFVEVAGLVCFFVGAFGGTTLTDAARCSFAWALPRYRRALLLEFAFCGAVIASFVALVGAASPAPSAPAFLVAAVAFATYSLGAALLLTPGGLLLLPVAFIAFVAFRSWIPAPVINAPVTTMTVSAAVSALALWPAFSSRTFRWSALVGPREDGRSMWNGRSAIPWWPRIRRGRAGAGPQSASRAPYVGTSVLRGVVSSYRPLRASAWFRALAFSVLYVVSVGPNALGSLPPKVFWIAWAIIFGFSAMNRASYGHHSSASRAMLPWSRRHHLSVAFARGLGDPLALLLVLSPALAIVALENPQALGPVGRGISVVAIFFPAFQWAAGPPTGGRWADRGVAMILTIAVVLVCLLALRLVVSGLPVLVSSGAAQAVVLGLLVAGSQALNWRRLKGYFATRDLVGGEP